MFKPFKIVIFVILGLSASLFSVLVATRLWSGPRTFPPFNAGDTSTQKLRVTHDRVNVLSFDEDAFFDVVETLGLMDEHGVSTNVNGNLTAYSIQDIRVVITDQRQRWIARALVANSQVFSTFNLEIDPQGNGVLFLHVEPSLYSDEDRLSKATDNSLRLALFAIHNWEGFSHHDQAWYDFMKRSMAEPSMIQLARKH